MAVTTTPEVPGTARKSAAAQTNRIGGGLLDPKMLWKSLPDAFKKLDPRVQVKNPVMFVVEIGAALTTYTAITNSTVFNWTIVAWLWLTVVFANLSGGRGRGPRQGAGGDPAPDQAGNGGAPADRLDGGPDADPD